MHRIAGNTHAVFGPEVPVGAALLIASRALSDAADLLQHSASSAPIDDYAGRDVLRGLGGMRPEEADAVTMAIVMTTLAEVCARLREQADDDWDEAIAQLGSAVRATRQTPRRVQHHHSRRPARPRAVPVTNVEHGHHPAAA